MNKLTVGLVLLFVSATIATVCPTVNYVCSDIGGQCTTFTSCTNCSNAYSACLAANSTCECYSQYVNCLSAAKNPNCAAAAQYDYCMSTIANCSCGTPYTGSVTDYTCRSNSFCEDSTLTCVALKTQGQSCTTGEDYQCSSNEMYAYPSQCKSGVCTQQLTGFAYPNDGCKTNTDCFFNDEGLGCVNGLCQAHAVTSSCTKQGSCGTTAFCNTTVSSCQANYAAGAACKTTTDNNLLIVCGQNMLCGGSNKCIEYYSQDLNAACIISEECKGDYVCLDSKCSNPLPVLACDTTSDCVNASSNYHGCSCGYCVRDTKGFTGCNDKEMTAWNCAQQNGCLELNNEFNFIPNSCIQNHCNDEFLCYYACQFAESSIANVVCPEGDISCPTPGSAATTVVSVVLSVVAVFALMF